MTKDENKFIDTALKTLITNPESHAARQGIDVSIDMLIEKAKKQLYLAILAELSSEKLEQITKKVVTDLINYMH